MSFIVKKEIREKLLEAGAIKVGFAIAGKTEEEIDRQYSAWIDEGCHGDMDYLQRHSELKRHTDNVLPGAKTVISLAFSYVPEKWRNENLSYIAAYAYGDDYHLVIREVLTPVLKELKATYGGKWRICIDSAPLAERYWALKSGIGKKGLNGSVIVDGFGSMIFLAEILTTVEIDPDQASHKECVKCGKCIDICPGQAIRKDGTVDARKCINYLTIEKKGEFSIEEIEILTKDKGYLYGCDRCMRVCPANKEAWKRNYSHLFSDKIITLTHEEIVGMTESEFKNIFSRSPLLYAGYKRLQRNARICLKDELRH